MPFAVCGEQHPVIAALLKRVDTVNELYSCIFIR